MHMRSTPHKVPMYISLVIMAWTNAMAIRYMLVLLNTFKPTLIKLKTRGNRWHWTLSIVWWRLERISLIMYIQVLVVPAIIRSVFGRIFRHVPTALKAVNCWRSMVTPQITSNCHWWAFQLLCSNRWVNFALRVRYFSVFCVPRYPNSIISTQMVIHFVILFVVHWREHDSYRKVYIFMFSVFIERARI